MNKLTARLVAVLLIAGFHFSGCSGSLGSLSIALASDATVHDNDASMSKFVASCDKTEETQESAQATSGCADGKTCLQRLHQFGTDRLTIPLGQGIQHIGSLMGHTAARVRESTALPLTFARNGPLYEQAPLIARSLVKRE